MRLRLWAACYNCLSLVAPYRTQEIAKELRTDFTILTGTRLRAWGGRDHIIERLDKGFAIHFGWAKGKWTNKHAGCTIIFGPKYSTDQIIKVEAAPAPIRGRGGAVRLRAWDKDLFIIAGYPPPVGTDTNEDSSSKEAAAATIEWIHRSLCCAPRRSFPVVGLDNCKLGMTTFNEYASELLVGDYNTSKQDATGDRILQLMEACDLAAAGTFWPKGGPTFFHHSGSSSTIDQFLIPRWALHNVASYHVAWHSARRLQLIPSGRPRDHVPVLMQLDYDIMENFGPSRLQTQWCFDKLGEALQTGRHRGAFLEELEAEFGKKQGEMNEKTQQSDPDASWRLWVDIVREIGLKHFSRHKPADQHTSNLKAKKARLMKERADLRTMAGLFWEDYQDWQGYTDELNSYVQEIKQTDKQLRQVRRRDTALRRRHLEVDLNKAIMEQRHAEAHRLAHALAGKATGPRKRVFRRLPSEQPPKATILEYMSLPGEEGGMSAHQVQWPEVAEDYRQEFSAFQGGDMNTRKLADDDLYRTTWRLKKTSKRKAAVPWSLPTELFLMALCPDYVSVGDKSRSGVGATKVTDYLNIAPTPVKALGEVLYQVRSAGTAPVDATISKGFLLDKNNKKQGMQAKRMIHIVCNFWKSFFAGMMDKQLEKFEADQPLWSHGFLRARRRESAMLTQRVMGWRLDKLKIPHVNELMDMSNAFGSIEREVSVEEAKNLFKTEDHVLVEERLRNSVVFSQGFDGEVAFMCDEGGLMGRSETPRIFLGVFHKTVLAWLLSHKETDKPMWLTDPISGRKVTGALVGFADDLFKKHVVHTGTAKEAIDILRTSSASLNEGLRQIKLKQNMDKREVVPRLKGRQNKKLGELLSSLHTVAPDGKQVIYEPQGLCRPWARHLGGAYTFNGSNHTEIQRRLHAMRVGWLSMGRFWFSRCCRAHKRIIYAGKVVEAGLSGLESYVFSQQELQKIEAVHFKYLRALELGKATTWEADHPRGTSNKALLRKWRLIPTPGELAIRRVKWLQSALLHPVAHRQLRAAIWGHLPGEPPTLNATGHLIDDCNPFARQFANDLWLYFGLSVSEDFFAEWEHYNFSWRSLLSEASLADTFEKLDASSLRTAALISDELWSRLVPQTKKAKQDSEFTCPLPLSSGQICGQSFSTLQGLVCHQIRKADHQYRQPLQSMIKMNQCPACHSTFSSVMGAKQHARFSWARGYCRLSCSHFAWPLVVPSSLTCPLCDFMATDSSSFQAHALTHLPPAPVSRDLWLTHAGTPRRKGRQGRRCADGEPKAGGEAGGRQAKASPQHNRPRRGRQGGEEGRSNQGWPPQADEGHGEAAPEVGTVPARPGGSDIRHSRHEEQRRRSSLDANTDEGLWRWGQGARQEPQPGATTHLCLDGVGRGSGEERGGAGAAELRHTEGAPGQDEGHEHRGDLRSGSLLPVPSDVQSGTTADHTGDQRCLPADSGAGGPGADRGRAQTRARPGGQHGARTPDVHRRHGGGRPLSVPGFLRMHSIPEEKWQIMLSSDRVKQLASLAHRSRSAGPTSRQHSPC